MELSKKLYDVFSIYTGYNPTATYFLAKKMLQLDDKSVVSVEEKIKVEIVEMKKSLG